jgi:hypothetical protein
MQRNFNVLAIPGRATATLACTSPHFLPPKEISRADLALVRRRNIGHRFDPAQQVAVIGEHVFFDDRIDRSVGFGRSARMMTRSDSSLRGPGQSSAAAVLPSRTCSSNNSETMKLSPTPTLTHLPRLAASVSHDRGRCQDARRAARREPAIGGGSTVTTRRRGQGRKRDCPSHAPLIRSLASRRTSAEDWRQLQPAPA